jgi:magnesium transporter
MIVNCAAYADGCRVADIDLEAISDYVDKPGHFVWVGLHEPDEDVLRKLQEELHLHDLAIEDALSAHQRPKLEEYGRCLFVVLRTGTWDEKAHSVITGETHLFVGERYIVSVRHGETLGYADVRKRCECSPHLLKAGPGFVLYALMDSIVDRYFPIIDSFEEEIETLEEAIFASRMDPNIAERIYELKREVIQAKRAVSPLIDVCNRLVRYDLGLIATRCGRTSATSTTTSSGSTRARRTCESSCRRPWRRTSRSPRSVRTRS